MSDPVRSTPQRQRLAALIGLIVFGVLAVTLMPGTSATAGGSRSSNSARPGGTRMFYELAERTGWRAERRVVALDSAKPSTVTHVVLGPPYDLGMREVHRLLEDVRAGGGLLFSMDGGEEIADSLGLRVASHGRILEGFGQADCPRDRSLRDRQFGLPPELGELRWTRPAPGPVDTLGRTSRKIDGLLVAAGFPLGAGRVAVISTSSALSNDAIRVCEWQYDLVAARMLEYLRGDGTRRTILFDEFHHGEGAHGGSLSAVWSYLSTTGSGRFLGQMLIAGILLLLAAAPRVIVPRDPVRVVRRSPIEHADALGHAYADVSATRTATRQLVSGLRRRVGRIVAVANGASDETFLEHTAQRFPSLTTHVGIVVRAMREALPNRELLAVGESIRAIEEQLSAQMNKLS